MKADLRRAVYPFVWRDRKGRLSIESQRRFAPDIFPAPAPALGGVQKAPTRQIQQEKNGRHALTSFVPNVFRT